jgi:hypothetical protein
VIASWLMTWLSGALAGGCCVVWVAQVVVARRKRSGSWVSARPCRECEAVPSLARPEGEPGREILRI